MSDVDTTTYLEGDTPGSALTLRHYATADALGQGLADMILTDLLQGGLGEPYLMGLPTGSTPQPLFRALVHAVAGLPEEQRSLVGARLYCVVMDDFVAMDTGLNVTPDDPWSAQTFILNEFLRPLSLAVNGTEPDLSKILFPKVGCVTALRDEVLNLGGLAIQVVATDPFEGHVAQNFSGQSFARAESAKVANLSESFLRHHEWAKGKYRGVTFDLLDFSTMVCRNAKGSFALVVTGESKKVTLKRLIEARRYDDSLPVSFLWLFASRATIWTDQVVTQV